jgi:MFS transporter, FHS family, glucose/mannose:H+ symporter
MANAGVASQKLSRRALTLEWCLLHAGFLATGIVTTLLGPLLPYLAAHWSLNDRQAGLFFTAQFLGSLLGVLATSFLLPRRGFAFALATGFAIMGAGVATLGLGKWTIGWLSVFGYGIGLGLTIPGANLFVSSKAGERSVAALSILNFAWSAGAVLCPLVVILAEPRVGLRGLTVLLGGIVALFAVAFTRSLGQQGERNEESIRPLAVWSSLLHRAHLGALALLFFLYVGTENALGGWVASRAKRAGMGADTFWVLAPSVFWGALLVGRAVAPTAWRFLGESNLARVALALAALGALVIFASTSSTAIRSGAAIAGLGLAPVFPILVARLTEALGPDAKWAGGLMFGSSSLGGAALPWLVGAVSTQTGSLRVGLGVPVLSCVLMLFLAWRRQMPQGAVQGTEEGVVSAAQGGARGH